MRAGQGGRAATVEHETRGEMAGSAQTDVHQKCSRQVAAAPGGDPEANQ